MNERKEKNEEFDANERQKERTNPFNQLLLLLLVLLLTLLDLLGVLLLGSGGLVLLVCESEGRERGINLGFEGRKR